MSNRVTKLVQKSPNSSLNSLVAGKDDFCKHGASPVKNRSAINQANIFTRIKNFQQYHMRDRRKQRSGEKVLLRMLQLGHYYPAASWLVPHGSKGMDLASSRLDGACSMTQTLACW
jgi:hypothetical protein